MNSAATGSIKLPNMGSGSGLNLGTNTAAACGLGMGWGVMSVIAIVALLALIGAVIYIFVYKPRTKPREGFASLVKGSLAQANGPTDRREGFKGSGAMGSVDEAVTEAIGPLPPQIIEPFSSLSEGILAQVGAPEGLHEGFGSVARGAGAPDCLRVLPDAAKVATALNDDSDDARELVVLVGKLACFKKDAIGTAQVIEATRYQPFSTSHDLQPITETISMCFAKNLPKRDLDLIFGKYRNRGIDLIHKLALAQNKSDRELVAYEKSYLSAMDDVTALAEQVCLGDSNPLLQGGGPVSLNDVGRVEGVTTGDVADLKPYDGYY